MFDWLGSVQVKERSPTRVELGLTSGTTWTGWALAAGGGWLITLDALWWILIGAVVLSIGVLLGTLQRRLVFDRDDGLLRSEQRIFGIRRRTAIPLFHLRSVVVARRGGIYIAYVERRLGRSIHLDEARRSAPLMVLAEAIAEVAELKLVYEPTTRVAVSD